MDTLLESGELEIGVAIGELVHRDFALRPATLADTYVAAAAVAVPDDLSSDQAARVAYQMAIDDALVLCQLASLGRADPVPGVAALVAAIDPDDMAILREAAARLKKKLRQSRLSFPLIVEPNTCSSELASA